MARFIVATCIRQAIDDIGFHQAAVGGQMSQKPFCGMETTLSERSRDEEAARLLLARARGSSSNATNQSIVAMSSLIPFTRLSGPTMVAVQIALPLSEQVRNDGVKSTWQHSRL
jgi:hypothetical protein